MGESNEKCRSNTRSQTEREKNEEAHAGRQRKTSAQKEEEGVEQGL